MGIGSMLAVDAGSRVVCHLCGEALAAVLAQHARRHGLTLADYRERFGLNGKQSLVAPMLAEKRRHEGRRRWAENPGVRDGLALGQQMAKSGVLHDIGVADTPRGPKCGCSGSLDRPCPGAWVRRPRVVSGGEEGGGCVGASGADRARVRWHGRGALAVE